MTTTTAKVTTPHVARLVAVVLGIGTLAVATWLATSAWPPAARTVAVVFVMAIGAWTATRLDDTVVALAACCLLLLTGALSTDAFFASLGDPTIWLLIGSCLLAAGVTASGLAARLAVSVIAGSRSVRGLAYRSTIALILTTFAIPATSSRAAIAVPVLQGMAKSLPTRVQTALSLVFPAVILLSAFASLLGAGAHLIAAGLIEQATGIEISFLQWMLLGAPVAIITSFLATELIVLAFLDDSSRAFDPRAAVAELRTEHARTHGATLSHAEWRALIVLVLVIVAWATSTLHGVHPAVVALIGGLVSVLPLVGTTTSKAAFAAVPWSLLIFLAATLALGTALLTSGVADRLTDSLVAALDTASPVLVLFIIVVVSAAAHLVVHSRSARSTVLVPAVIALAMASGLNPVAAALASTAAAGFCLTLTASAKPVAMFAEVPGVATFDRRQLLALSGMLAPAFVGIVMLAAALWWPLLGIPLASP